MMNESSGHRVHKSHLIFAVAGCFLALLLMLAIAACSESESGSSAALQSAEDTGRAVEVSSDSFRHGDRIPPKYTCDGQDISPPISWRGIPADTASLALFMDDPDAPGGIWVHWVLYNLPPELNNLVEGATGGDQLGGGVQGVNSWNRPGYGGPCPPSGIHRYIFRVYALDTLLDLGPGASKDDLLQAVEGHILGEGQLMGLYSRS